MRWSPVKGSHTRSWSHVRLTIKARPWRQSRKWYLSWSSSGKENRSGDAVRQVQRGREGGSVEVFEEEDEQKGLPVEGAEAADELGVGDDAVVR